MASYPYYLYQRSELRYQTLVLVSVVSVCQAVAWSATAQPLPADVAAGRRIAEGSCSQCHVIIRNGPAGWTDAPSFEVIANKPATTSAWLQSFVMKPHIDMMHRIQNRSDAAKVAAYILSLKRQ
jgi:mono/diheme cytochrome c family protein